MMKQTLTSIIVTSHLLISQTTSAQNSVALFNPHLGSLEIDLSSDLSFKIPISLHYSSRSLFDGYFGRGWCSSYDWRILKRSQQYYLKKCEIIRNLKPSEYRLTDQLLILKNENGYRTGFSQKTESVIFSQRIDSNQVYVLEKSAPNMIKKGPLLSNVSFESVSLTFSYDETDNLTRIKNHGKDALIVNYDPRMDLLLSLEIPEKCRYQFAYQKENLTLKTTIQEDCQKQKTSKTQLIQTFAKTKDENLRLVSTERLTLNNKDLQ